MEYDSSVIGSCLGNGVRSQRRRLGPFDNLREQCVHCRANEMRAYRHGTLAVWSEGSVPECLSS